MKLFFALNILLLSSAILLFVFATKKTDSPPEKPAESATSSDSVMPDLDREAIAFDLLARAQQLREAGDAPGALRRLDTALKLAPGAPTILRAKAELLQVARRLREAGEIFCVPTGRDSIVPCGSKRALPMPSQS